MASDAWSSLVKSVWFCFISTGKMSNNLLANNLAYNLMTTFNRDIGQKLDGTSGDLPGLGRVMTKALSISAGNVPLDMASLNKGSKLEIGMCLNVL